MEECKGKHDEQAILVQQDIYLVAHLMEANLKSWQYHS